MPKERTHVVEQGDHIDRIAFRSGLSRDDIWNHPANAALKAKRKPTILYPGDVLVIPESPEVELHIEAGTTNSYVAKVPKIPVRLLFKDEKGFIANEPYELRGAGAPITGTTDGAGKLHAEVPETRARSSWSFRAEARSSPGEGASRLDEGERAELMTEALEIFQRQAGLKPTGVPDDATRRALADRHGS